jgi:hypothetical protein
MTDKEKISQLQDQIKSMKKESKAYLSYKQLIIAAAKSKETIKNIMDTLKFVAKQIKAKNWRMVDRISGVSGDLMARGTCPICDINLIGDQLRPREFTLPCKVAKCPFEGEGEE